MVLVDQDQDWDQADETRRGALPAGDPLAWSILVAGTSLDGTAWPGWGSSGGNAPVREPQL